MSESEPKSITMWFEQLRQGNQEAASELWDRFFHRLVNYSRRHMSQNDRRVSDEEDIAAGVMAALCQCADRGKLPSINNRDDLWRLLLCWTRHDISDQNRAAKRIKRGSGKVRGDSVFGISGDGFDRIASELATPADVLMEMNERFEVLLTQLQSENLRQIAVLRMHGHSNEEIAKEFDVSLRTIERKLNLIRATWTA